MNIIYIYRERVSLFNNNNNKYIFLTIISMIYVFQILTISYVFYNNE